MQRKRFVIILLIILFAFIGIVIGTEINLKRNNNTNVTKNIIESSKNNETKANEIINNTENLEVKNNVEENNMENSNVNQNEISNVTTNNAEEINKEELQTYANNEEKAVAIVKKQWGEDSINRFNAYQNSDGTYTVEIIKPDTSVWCRYNVNVETEKCQIME